MLLHAALEPDRPRDAVVAEMALGRRDEARLPSKLPLLDNHHLIGPGHLQDRGAISPKHPRASPRSSRGSITGLHQCDGAQVAEHARRHGPVRVAAAWEGNSSKITHSCWSVAGQTIYKSPANDRRRARDVRSTLQQRRRQTRTIMSLRLPFLLRSHS